MVKSLIPWRKKDRNDISRYKNEMDAMFDQFISRFSFLPFEPVEDKQLFPSTDVIEGKKNIIVNVEMPGMNQKDIDITLSGRLLTIKGEKKREEKEEGDNYHRIETFYGSYHRSIELPAEVDASSVEATYKKGVLKVALRKTKASDTKTIQIKSV